MMTIVADYLHDREPLRHTLHRLDTEMVVQESKSAGSSRTKSLLKSSNPITFLEHLHHDVAHFEQYFAVDYVELSRICGRLFSTMTTDEMQERVKRAAFPAEKCIAVMYAVLQNLVAASETALPGTPAAAELPQATHIARVLKIYMQGDMDPIRLHRKFSRFYMVY